MKHLPFYKNRKLFSKNGEGVILFIQCKREAKYMAKTDNSLNICILLN